MYGRPVACLAKRTGASAYITSFLCLYVHTYIPEIVCAIEDDVVEERERAVGHPSKGGSFKARGLCGRSNRCERGGGRHIRGNKNVGTSGNTMFSREHALDPAPFWILGRNGVHTN